MRPWVLAILTLVLVGVVAVSSGRSLGASAWTLSAKPVHAKLEQTARVTLQGPALPTKPVLVVVEDGSPLKFPFRKTGPQTYQARAKLLVPGTLTLQAKDGTRVLATTIVSVAPRPGGSGLKILAGVVLLGFVFWFWYRNHQLTGGRR